MDRIKKYLKIVQDYFKSIHWKDPMVIILSSLLVFLTLGSVIGSIVIKRQARNELKKPLVILDATYGGEQKGYEGIVNEADVAEKTVTALEKKLLVNGYRVKRTHPAGTFVTLEEKLKLIKNSQPALVLSIRAGHSDKPETAGVRFYANPKQSETDSIAFALKNSFSRGHKGVWAGYLFYKQAEKNTQVANYVDLGGKKEKLETWAIMNDSDKKIIVAEQFFITNQNDVKTWHSDKGYEEIAKLYLSAIQQVIKK
ncbi:MULTISPECIES: N-acetylmuramoyl-L-alanine amidase [Terrabacteria group]|uniref:N-acetylmuramoyl-L-alanine amidase n=1 Tax=Bacillati TaxID=1783272 RepID=UPI001C6E8D5A|nr:MULTISPECIES: N-acetylmuramoyl-L-alanine amidase [Terrabacteria group]MBW9212715.1 N-acetylmuramoyl-L-alanine amidase [Trueperella sp. zg.1013]